MVNIAVSEKDHTCVYKKIWQCTIVSVICAGVGMDMHIKLLYRGLIAVKGSLASNGWIMYRYITLSPIYSLCRSMQGPRAQAHYTLLRMD